MLDDVMSRDPLEGIILEGKTDPRIQGRICFGVERVIGIWKSSNEVRSAALSQILQIAALHELWCEPSRFCGGLKNIKSVDQMTVEFFGD